MHVSVVEIQIKDGPTQEELHLLYKLAFRETSSRSLRLSQGITDDEAKCIQVRTVDTKGVIPRLWIRLQ
jgi:hypothetical protein